VNLGVGGGIAGASDGFLVKAIVAFELGRLWQTAVPGESGAPE
jgi:hypothetical protein